MSKKFIYGLICFGITNLLCFKASAEHDHCHAQHISCIHHKSCNALKSPEGIHACTTLLKERMSQPPKEKTETELTKIYKEACRDGCLKSPCNKKCAREE